MQYPFLLNITLTFNSGWPFPEMLLSNRPLYHSMGQAYTPDKQGVSYPDHTADVWLSVEASNIEDLILRAIEGLYGIIAEEYDLDVGSDAALSFEAGNLETLLVTLLSDFLYYFEAEGSIFRGTSVSLIEDRGQHRIDIVGSKHDFEIPEGRGGIEIKAVTYHGAEVKSNDAGKWHMKLLLDV